MQKVAIDDVDSAVGPAAVFRPLSAALDTTGLALNYFELEAGDSFGFCYHRHHEQEEVFYVMEGTATFETESGTVPVGPDEVIRFAPGEWQRGTNRGAERVRALAIGAPREQGETDLLRECPVCGERTPAAVRRSDDGEVVTTCLDCGGETGRFR
jgi:mannose-6-phosphate isomerase-like protein (cupin superfamily)